MTTRLIHTPSGFVTPEDIDYNASPVPGAAFAFSSEPRVCGNVIRYQAGSDSAPSDVEQTRHSHTTTGTNGGSVAATLNSTFGRPSVELIPGDPSTRTSVETALREGLIRRNPWGQFEDVLTDDGKQPALAADPTEKEAPADLSEGAFDASDDTDWAADIDPLPQHSYDGAVASVVAVVAHGMGSLDDTAKALAASAAISPELAREYVQEGVAMHERAVARAVAPMGLTGGRLEQFYEAVRSQPAKLQDALQRLVHARDVSGFKALAVAFKVANPVDVSAYRAAGFQTSVDRDTGDLLLKRPGGDWVKASDLK